MDFFIYGKFISGKVFNMIARTPKKMAGIRLVTVILAAVMVLSVATAVVAWLIPGSTANGGGIRPLEGTIVNNRDQYLDSSVMYKLPETIKATLWTTMNSRTQYAMYSWMIIISGWTT